MAQYMTNNINDKRYGLRALRYIVLLMMVVVGVGEMWGATVTYHIINLGRLDDIGQLTTSRTEALKFTVTADNVTVGIPDKYKSPLAKNWAYYSSSDLTGPLHEGDALTNGAHVYVTYELNEDAFSTLGVEDGGIYRIKFPNDYYLRQTMYKTEINTDSKSETNPTASEYLWKFNIVDPYQITIQSQSNDYTNHYLSSKTGKTDFSDIRLQPTLADAKATKAWAFSLLPGGLSGTYRLIVADGSTVASASGNQLDSFGHGYLNNKRENYKTTYHLYNYANYERCDLTIEFLSAKYKFHIINNSGEEAMSAKTASALDAGDAITEAMIPDMLKSPAASDYKFYPTAEDAIAGTNELSSLSYSSIHLYVRYETSGSGIYLNGEIKYNLSVGGAHYLYAADATTISSAADCDAAAKTYRWALLGGDPYQIKIKNKDNNQFVTYDVSGGEAVPTLSATGSKFFLHQSTSGKYELVAVPNNNYPISYYTLGYDDTNGLRLYSKNSYSFESAAIQTVFTPLPAAIIDPLPTANDLIYNGLEQALVTAGTCVNGTIKYREGTTGDYTTDIPKKTYTGTYSVYYMSEGNGNYEDYVAVDPIIVTIAPKQVTVKAVNKTKVYGNPDPPLTATVTGLVSGELESLITYTLSRADGEDVGNYTITPDGDALQGNYDVTFETGKLTINKKTVTITWGETTLPYNGTPQAPTATATGLAFNDKNIGVTVTGAQTNVGTGYTATASALTGKKAGNYALPAAKTKEFSIVKASINTSIVMTEWSYGDYNALTNSPSLSYNPEEVEVTYLYKVKDADDEYAAAVPTAVGTYTVQASIPGTTNSIAQVLTKDFTISKKALNKDAAGTPADGISITVSKVEETFNVTVTQMKQGVSTPLTPYVDANTDYDFTWSGEATASDYVVTITAKNENGTYTGNYTGFAKAAYPKPTFYLDGATWSPSGNEYAAVYLGMSDGVPNPVEFESEVKAYIVKRVNQTIGTVTVSPVEYISTTDPPTKTSYIPKGVPVLLLSNKRNTTGFAISSPTEDTSDITETAKDKNQLMIAPEGGVPVKDTEAYVFYQGEFVLTKEGTISPGKFFLYNPNYTPSSAGGGGGGPSGVRRYLRIVVEENEDPDSMSEELRVKSEGFATAEGWYTLDGRRLDGKPTRKGIYITNGKKMYFK